jgi:HEAT repeat protein
MTLKLRHFLITTLVCGNLVACFHQNIDLDTTSRTSCRNPEHLTKAIAPETSPEIVTALRAFVDNSSPAERKSTIDTLVKIGPKVIIPLFSIRKSSCYWGTDLLDGMYAVAQRIGDPAIPQLISLLQLNSGEESIGGTFETEALGKIGKSAIPQLVPLLKHPNIRVRFNATEALGRIGKPAIAQLTSISKENSDLSIRTRAAYWLKKLNTTS